MCGAKSSPLSLLGEGGETRSASGGRMKNDVRLDTKAELIVTARFARHQSFSRRSSSTFFSLIFALPPSFVIASANRYVTETSATMPCICHVSYLH